MTAAKIKGIKGVAASFLVTRQRDVDQNLLPASHRRRASSDGASRGQFRLTLIHF